MKLRTHLVLFLFIFAVESRRTIREFGNDVPHVGDAIEVHNIGFNLAQGRGYRFDWDNASWRGLLQEQNGDGGLDFILVRRGSHPTMFRPPLMPMLVAGTIWLFPNHSFLAWRVFDSAGFAAGACVLCDIAFVHAGAIGLIAMLVMLLSDQLRRTFVPGWWTEGLAFDLLCVVTWLLTKPKRLSLGGSDLIAGISVGLLCLDRSVFVLMILPLCALLGLSMAKSFCLRAKHGLTILAIAMAVQLPWWARNVEISGRFLPLGTQGGFNLPDEYGEVAFKQRIWTGWGMRDAWTPPTVAGPNVPIPPGFTETSFDKLFGGSRRMEALVAATFCGTLESEISVSERGKETALRWIRSNYWRIPSLMLLKAEELTFFFHTSLLVASGIGLIGFIALPAKRRPLVYLSTFVAMYFGVIALTHVVWWRFLLPILPAIYVAVSIGIYAIVTMATDFILARFLQRLL